MFAITCVLLNNWKKTPMPKALTTEIRLLIGMHCFDMLIFATDLMTVLLRRKFLLSFRQIASAIGLTLGVIVQIEFFMTDEAKTSVDDFIKVDDLLKQGIDQWVFI
jgi:hypothetical protein